MEDREHPALAEEEKRAEMWIAGFLVKHCNHVSACYFIHQFSLSQYSQEYTTKQCLQDTCNAFTTKQWWNIKVGNSQWKDFFWAKYCQRIKPVRSRGNYALDVWKVICGTFGIPSKDILLRQLLINWWRQNTSNPVYSIIVKYLPALTIWEIWKSRCEAKYGSQKINVNKSISQIAFNISQLVNHFLGSNKMKASWEEAESDTKLLVDCIKKKSTPPWTIANEVKRLQDLLNPSEYSITHCYREINQVADKLASLSHKYNTNILYSKTGELPSQIKGLITTDCWSLPIIRVSNRMKKDFTFNPP
uniref:RNase H type-1 domain-containing protein n=1 Tax=Solanum lycopersicum TaxID=4081 RepID=A0A3Q7IE99_SOLLC